MNGIILIGRPGSGKSTIGKELASRLGMIYVSSGDVARKISGYDPQTRSNLSLGRLAPEELIRHEIYRILYRINFNNDGFVLDGFPRSYDQMVWLSTRFPSLIIIRVLVPKDVCIDRLINRGREDDTELSIRNRMDYYDRHTDKIFNELVCPYLSINNIYSTVDIVGELVEYIHWRQP